MVIATRIGTQYEEPTKENMPNTDIFNSSEQTILPDQEKETQVDNTSVEPVHFALTLNNFYYAPTFQEI